jgi:hypothetical protein
MLFWGCHSYPVKKEITSGKIFSKKEKVAVLLHVSESSRIGYNEYEKNFEIWKSSYKRSDRLSFVKGYETEEANPGVYTQIVERFYQVNGTNKFLKYKSLGIVKAYCNTYRSELNAVFSKTGADHIVLYEVGGTYSANLKAMKVNTVMVIVDKKFDVQYLDHQNLYIGDVDFDGTEIRNGFIDVVVNRLYKSLSEMDVVDTL